MKRILALILALFMLVALFAACGKKDNTPDKGDKQDDNKGDKSAEQADIVIRDFGGADYNILTNSLTDYEFSGTLAGDNVQYAVMERQYEIEKQFGVTVNVTSKKGGWGERKDFTAAVRAEKMSGGTDGYDLISTHSVYLGWMGIENLGKDMALYSDYIDFSKPWWNQNLYDELNLQGHVFMMIGDIAYTLYQYITVMFVNETEFENYFADEGGVDMLYDLVNAGEWTWAKLWEFASAYGTGESGDGKYGIFTGPHAWRASFISQEASLFQKDGNGKMSLANALPRKESNIVQDMIENYAKDNLRFEVFGFKGTGNTEITPVFLAGNVLFYPQTLDEAQKLFSGASEDYGIVPLPKYDTMQEQYKTQCRDTVTGNMIMSTSKDPERTAIVTEGMAYYGHKIVVPAYYEQSLVNRYVDKYVEILDTIRAGLTYQPCDAYIQSSSGDVATMRWDLFHQIVLGNGAQADTVYARAVPVAKNELNTFYIKLAKLGINY